MARNFHNSGPVNLVIFGITGDLSKRYILPAIAALETAGELPTDFKLVGLSRQKIKSNDILGEKTKALTPYLHARQMDMANLADYKNLKGWLGESGQTIFYLSVPPVAVVPIIRNLSAAGLNGPNAKLLLEKPFGFDLDSAQELIAETQKHFKENQVYRIDHYLAKGMVQNLTVFLSSNVLFRNVWNNKFIDFIEIVVAEKIGIEGRTAFYEQTGALRDIVQSHLLQLVAIVLMEPCPDPFNFSDLPKRRLAALEALAPPTASQLPSRVLRGQYEGYRHEVKNKRSNIETLVSLHLESTNPRWAGVPIYLATGKNLDRRLTQIRINFKKEAKDEANQLILRVQPDEGIELDIWARKPGLSRELEKKTLNFSYQDEFNQRLPDAYEQVLADAISSRPDLFASSTEVLASWRLLQPIINYWSMSNDDLVEYKPGSSLQAVLKKAYNNR